MFTFDFLLSKKKVLFAYSECNAVIFFINSYVLLSTLSYILNFNVWLRYWLAVNGVVILK